MRITLVNPIGVRSAYPDIFMSVLYLGTALKRAGHEVRVIDAQVENAESELRPELKKSDAFGFSVMTTQLKHALKLSDMVKEHDKSIPVIWGGAHPTFFPRQTVSDKSVDYAIRGEGEMTIIKLADFLEGKGSRSAISGLAYMDGKKFVMNEMGPFLDLNSLSPPEWGLLKMEKYIHDFRIGKDNYGKSLPVHSGRGCVHRCAFCINLLSKMRWRPLTAENIFNEVRLLKEKYGIDYIKFVDENFFTNKHRVEKFCRIMIREGMDVKWHALGKASYFNESHMSEGLLKLAKKAGCAVISMGIESGSQKMLDYMRKDITNEDTMRAVKTCEKLGIKPICSFMMGLPHETKGDIRMTLDMIRRIRSISPSSMIIGPQVFRPYPGCSIYEEIKKMIREPDTIREWAKEELIGGYRTAKHLPWLEDPKYIENIWFYINRSSVEPSTLLKRIFEGPFKLVAQFRVNHNIFGLSIDKKLFELLEKVYFMGEGGGE